jgi:hypothetical protein
MVSK